MNIRDLNHQNVCILGFGQEGRVTLQALQTYAPGARVTIADTNPELEVEGQYATITGPNYLTKLTGFDTIIKSPGIPWRPGSQLAAKLTSATQLFLDSLPAGAQVIGVTGTKGKSTTANLIYHALKAGGLRVFLAGNIGEPMLGLLGDASPATTFVLELSSYQLETLTTSPHIAVVTSFFPDHLDYHEGLKPYHEAKKNIARHQKPSDIIFYNPTYPECHEIARLSPGRHIAFTDRDYPGGENPAIRGLQNTCNLAAAYLVARECGVNKATAIKALETAPGLPHRQERLGTFHRLEWIDDSAANTPEAAVSAIRTLGSEIGTIIVGGLDRGYDLQELGATLARSNISNVILFPQTGPKLRAIIEAAPDAKPKQFFETTDMAEAVQFARQHTPKGYAVLLSNGAPSYNLFKNFTQRAQSFKDAIQS